MAVTFCAHCGRSVPPASAFCPSCGAAVNAPAVGAAPLPSASGLPPGTTAAPPFAGFPAPAWGGPDALRTTRERPWDVKALRAVRWSAVLGLVGSLVGLVAIALPGFTSFLLVTSTSGGPVLSLSAPVAFGAYTGAAAALACVAILFYRRGFGILSEVSKEFSTPSTLALVALIGVVVVIAGFGILLVALAQAIACAGSGNPVTTSCLLTGTFWGGLALLGAGAVVALVGYIGILIGIWRLGSRYNRGTFKAGAILLIIPYLSVVGYILILLGASQELGRAG